MKKKSNLNRIPLAFILPAFLLLLAVAIVPFVYGVGISFFRYRFTGGAESLEFVGLANYVYEFTQDPVFAIALVNSLIWVIIVDGGCLVLGLFMALRLNREFRGRSAARVLAWLPWATPFIAVAVIWQIIYQPSFGLLNGIFDLLGIGRQRWLSDPDTALYAVAAAQVWRWIPFYTITLLASLQAIPKELYEAAEVDGASRWQSFRFVTVPMLRSSIGLTLIIGTIWAFKTFALVYSLTGGGPANSSQILSTWGYQLAFRFGYVDRGAVVGTVTAIILILIGAVWVQSEARRLRREDR